MKFNDTLVSESAKHGLGAGWYDGYRAKYTIREARLEIARALAWKVDGADMPNLARPSYNALAALWGDKPEVSKRYSDALFRLTQLADENQGQNVAVFNRGRPEALEDTPFLESDIVLRIGVLRASGGDTEGTKVGPLYNRFLGKKDFGPDNIPDGIGMFFDVGLNVDSGVQNLRVSISKFAEVSYVDTDKIAVFSGAVSLDRDMEKYREHRKLAERHIVFGNLAVNQLVQSLTHFATEQAVDNWRALMPSPDNPMIDLTHIFPRQVPIAE